jgi:nucleoside-diphosphate-sugar epimerase
VGVANGYLSPSAADTTWARQVIAAAAVSRTNDWGVDLDVNVDGLGALMYACRTAKAMLHCSTTAVYLWVPKTYATRRYS